MKYTDEQRIEKIKEKTEKLIQYISENSNGVDATKPPSSLLGYLRFSCSNPPSLIRSKIIPLMKIIHDHTTAGNDTVFLHDNSMIIQKQEHYICLDLNKTLSLPISSATT